MTPIWFWRSQARDLCTEYEMDPDELIPMPGGPLHMTAPRWVWFAKYINERSVEWRDMVGVAFDPERHAALIEKVRQRQEQQ